MPDQHIELSKEGIKISYLRFLSDSAAGQIVILMAVAAYYLPIFGKTSLQRDLQPVISPEAKILVIVLLILLSSPLGLAINSASYFLLSWLQVRMQWYLFEERKPKLLFKRIREAFEIQVTKDYFHLSGGDWYPRSQFIKQALHIYHPHIIDSFDHVRGMRTLFRNISFLALIFFAASLFFNRGSLNGGYILQLAIWCGLFFLVPIIISSLLSFHYTSHALYRAYILCLATKRGYDFKHNFHKAVVSALSTEVRPTI
jgi:hypothetical protein